MCNCRPADVVNDAGIKSMVNEQAKEWTELIGRHLKEEAALMIEQREAQKDILKPLAEGMQANQLKTLEAHFEK